MDTQNTTYDRVPITIAGASSVGSQFVRDRLVQALAEMSLEQADSQFPVDIVLESSGSNPPVTIRSVAVERVNQLIASLTREGVYPMGRVDPGYFSGGTRAPDLSNIPVNAGRRTAVLDITRKISSGTAQGTVYTVDLRPNESLHYVAVIDGVSGLTKMVTGVMKKSPIFDPYVWYKYVAARSLRDFVRTHTRKQALLDPGLRSAFSFAGLALRDFVDLRLVDVDEYIVETEKRLLDQYNDLNNDAYVDAIGYYFGSMLQEYGISPFFGLFYGSFRANDTSYFDDDVVRALGPAVNVGFPVQLTVIQPLRDTFYRLSESGFFLSNPSRSDKDLNMDKLWSLAAQGVFGLSAAQKFFGLTHNDFHGGNLLYEQFPEDHALFFRRPTTNTFYRIPTDGKVFKMIDFGRATYDIGGYRFGSATMEEIAGGWNSHGEDNDLYKFAMVIASEFGFGAYMAGSARPRDPRVRKFVEMLKSIVTCDGKTPWQSMSLCRNPTTALRRKIEAVFGPNSSNRCGSYVMDIRPYEVGSGCVNAVPRDNIRWFDRFIVAEESVPRDAIVYLVI